MPTCSGEVSMCSVDCVLTSILGVASMALTSALLAIATTTPAANPDDAKTS